MLIPIEGSAGELVIMLLLIPLWDNRLEGLEADCSGPIAPGHISAADGWQRRENSRGRR